MEMVFLTKQGNNTLPYKKGESDDEEDNRCGVLYVFHDGRFGQ
jgi:hypothetical protein